MDIEDRELLDRLTADFDATYPERGTAHLEQAHLARTMAAAQLMTSEGPAMPGQRRIPIMKQLLATKLARVAAVTVACLLALSGVAFAGVLPSPVQNVVADTVAPLGIDLPGGDDEAVEAPDTDADEAADVEDDQGEDADEADEVEQADEDDAADATEDATDEDAEGDEHTDSDDSADEAPGADD